MKKTILGKWRKVMSYSITRRNFMKQASEAMLVAGTMMLVGCGSSSGGSVSGSVGEDGEKIIVKNIKTSIGKEEVVEQYNHTTYKIEDVFKEKIDEESMWYGYHVFVSSGGCVLADENFRVYVDGKKVDDTTINMGLGLGNYVPGEGGILSGGATNVTVKGKAPVGGKQLKIEILAQDMSFTDGETGTTTREQTIITCETEI